MKGNTVSIHPTAIIHSKAELAADVTVGPFCVIEAEVRVSAGCRLYQGVYLTGRTTIGENCELHPGVIIGHAPQDAKYNGERSYCRIGKNTILREYVTVHRGTMADSETVVGDDCFLLGGAHVGHNARVGNNVTLINNVALGGHVEVEDRVTVGGATGVHQFVRIGELAMITGNARVAKDVPPFALVESAGRIAGLNRLGMRRAAMPADEVREIREAYRLLYGRGGSFREAVQRTCDLVKTPAGQRLARFLQASTDRGVAGRSRSRTSVSRADVASSAGAL